MQSKAYDPIRISKKIRYYLIFNINLNESGEYA